MFPLVWPTLSCVRMSGWPPACALASLARHQSPPALSLPPSSRELVHNMPQLVAAFHAANENPHPAGLMAMSNCVVLRDAMDGAVYAGQDELSTFKTALQAVSWAGVGTWGCFKSAEGEQSGCLPRADPGCARQWATGAGQAAYC